VRTLLSLSALTAATAATLSWSADQGQEADEVVESFESDEEVYRAACAACHGAEVAGMPQRTVGFDTPLPDFTDCSFATREPDGDWFAVVHEGGPVRGFSHLMPAFGTAMSDEEIQMALDHVRTFCDEEGWPSGDLNLPRAMFTEKAYVEDEAVFTFGAHTELPMAVLGEFVYETRLGTASQVEVLVPVGIVQLDGDDGSGSWVAGLGDVGFALKHVFVASRRSGTIFSGIGEVFLPTGTTTGGIGSGAVKFEPTVAFGQLLGAAGFVQLQAGLEIPVESDATLEALWRGVYGLTFTQGRFGRSWSPMVEVLGTSELEKGATPHFDVVPQLRSR
jgi:cytochrome c5